VCCDAVYEVIEWHSASIVKFKGPLRIFQERVIRRVDDKVDNDTREYSL